MLVSAKTLRVSILSLTVTALLAAAAWAAPMGDKDASTVVGKWLVTKAGPQRLQLGTQVSRVATYRDAAG